MVVLAITLDFCHKISYKYEQISEVGHDAYLFIWSYGHNKMEAVFWQVNAKVSEVKSRNARNERNAQIGFWTPRQS